MIKSETAIDLRLSPAQREAAYDAVERLARAPNQELRGRTPLVGLAQTERFLRSDPVYAAFEAARGDTELGSATFRAEVEHKLHIFERRANRNPGILPDTFRTSDRTAEYRVITQLIFDAFPSNPLSNENLTPRESSPESPQPELIAAQPFQAVSGPAAAEVRSEVTALREQIVQPIRDSGPELLGMCEQFIRLELTTLEEHLQFSELLEDVEKNSADRLIVPLVQDFVGPEGRDHLKTLNELRQGCRHLSEATEASFASITAILGQMDRLRAYGLTTTESWLEKLTERGYLTSVAAQELQLGRELLPRLSTVTRNLACNIPEKCTVTASDMNELHETVVELTLLMYPSTWIEHRLAEPLKRGPEKISHLKRLATLARWDVPIEQFLVTTAEGAEVIRRAAEGALVPIPQSEPGYKKILGRSLQISMELTREPNQGIRAAVRHGMEGLEGTDGIRAPEIQSILHTFARQARCPDIEGHVRRLAHALNELSSERYPIAKLREIALVAPRQYDTAGDEKVILFLENLVHLDRLNVKGIEKLLDNSLVVLRARAKGDDTQHFSGFPIEAATAVALSKSEYTIIGLSSPIRHGFEYDIIARSKAGETLGIEVKRTLDTLVSKNYKEHHSLGDNIVGTQLYRHAEAARFDAVTPVVAVIQRPVDSWAQTPVGHLLSSIESKLKIRPRVVNRLTGAPLEGLW